LVPIVLGVALLGGSFLIASTLSSQSFRNSESGSPAEREWQQLDSQAQRDFERGNMAGAEARYTRALELAEKFGAKDRRLLVTLHRLQDIYYTEKKFSKADEVEARIKALMSDESP
ncbi:MAG: hypothetical protein K2X27_18815, partial [Candidatus Obscuribacterales bacterium]|nr:hypothetical protein [Candidatus Obscuribacterales bacterium]